ncbi:MAG: hypothetical protein KDA64_07805 [Rhodospirillaceae bacterium]|nr:hypothetical protein [Rhodospirillaceae bacterium]
MIEPAAPPAAATAAPTTAAGTLAQHLGTAPEGAVVPLAAGGAGVGQAEVGGVYVAASGHTCRLVTARLTGESVQLALCESAGQWAFSQPLRYSATAEQMVAGRISVR